MEIRIQHKKKTFYHLLYRYGNWKFMTGNCAIVQIYNSCFVIHILLLICYFILCYVVWVMKKIKCLMWFYRTECFKKKWEKEKKSTPSFLKKITFFYKEQLTLNSPLPIQKEKLRSPIAGIPRTHFSHFFQLFSTTEKVRNFSDDFSLFSTIFDSLAHFFLETLEIDKNIVTTSIFLV